MDKTTTLKDSFSINKNIFCYKFKSLLKSRNIGQAEFADMIGVSRQTINYYCNGKNWPDVPTLLEIAKYFNVSIDYLLTDTESKYKSDEIYHEDIASTTSLSIDTINALINNHKHPSLLESDQIFIDYYMALDPEQRKSFTKKLRSYLNYRDINKDTKYSMAQTSGFLTANDLKNAVLLSLLEELSSWPSIDKNKK